jgi:hypothetical protein
LIEYADGVILPIFPAHLIASKENYASVAVTTISDPDEVGIKFIAPHSGKIIGPHVWGRFFEDTLFTIYDADDNVLATYTVLWDDEGTGDYYENISVVFDAGVTVKQGSTYRITQKAVTGTARLYYSDWSAPVAAAVYGGANLVYTQRTAGGAWTDTPTRKPHWSVLYSEFNSDAIPTATPPGDSDLSTSLANNILTATLAD